MLGAPGLSLGPSLGLRHRLGQVPVLTKAETLSGVSDVLHHIHAQAVEHCGSESTWELGR